MKSWLHYGRQRLANAMKEDPMTLSPALPTATDPSVAELLQSYSKQFDQDPLTADHTLLAQTRERLKAEIQRLPLSSELVHLAMAIHWNWAADPASLAPMLAAYLQQPLTVDEEVWARYEYVNILTVLNQYALSIPLHRYVVEVGYNQEYVYKWLAASVWAYSGDRSEALELLRQGRARARSLEEYQADFVELPEFQDVLEAPDFLEAITVPSP